MVGGDTVFQFASYYVFGGLLVWLSLIVVFHQHTLERLEALEEDELAAGRGGAGSVFEAATRSGSPARRLRLMHQWMMPAVSLLVMIYLGLGAFWMLGSWAPRRSRRERRGPTSTPPVTGHLGWAVATCLAFAAVSFIFSRFVAGMARQPAWQNLRGGAGYMVGNALIMLAAAVGIIFRFFRRRTWRSCRRSPTWSHLHAVPGLRDRRFNFILNSTGPGSPARCRGRPSTPAC